MTWITEISLFHYLYLGMGLFFLGLFGMLIRRNILVILMCIEIMLNAINLMLVATSQYYGSLEGQIITFFVMTIAAAEVGVGLAIAVQAYRRFQTVGVHFFNKMKG